MSAPQPERGGFLIPEGVRSEILKTALETSIMSAPDWYGPVAGKPVPRRTRLRWRLGAQRERAAELAYRLVSGHDVPESDY